MASKTQCPNCGGYRTEWWETNTNGFKANALGCLTGFGIYSALASCFIIFVAIASPRLPNNYNSDPMGPIFFAVIAVAIFVGLYFCIDVRRRIRMSGITQNNYKCELCGYSWGVKVGNPQPPVTVRPDLIAKGAQMVEEKRREQEEARRAAFFLDQQRRRKK